MRPHFWQIKLAFIWFYSTPLSHTHAGTLSYVNTVSMGQSNHADAVPVLKYSGGEKVHKNFVNC